MTRICVALDVPWERAIKIVRDLYDFFENYPLIMKIGHRIYLEKGGDALRELKEEFPYEVFLDLKLHDIPSVVGLAVEEINNLGADYITLHLLGGERMVEEATKRKGNTKVLGVSLLTSHDESYLSFLRTTIGDIKEFVLYLAKMGLDKGIDGVVCSGEEVEFLKKNVDKEFIAVVPGIRIKKEKGDQSRVLTPAEAKKRGADIIVIGREITESKNPVYVVERALKMMGEI